MGSPGLVLRNPDMQGFPCVLSSVLTFIPRCSPGLRRSLLIFRRKTDFLDKIRVAGTKIPVSKSAMLHQESRCFYQIPIYILGNADLR